MRGRDEVRGLLFSYVDLERKRRGDDIWRLPVVL